VGSVRIGTRTRPGASVAQRRARFWGQAKGPYYSAEFVIGRSKKSAGLPRRSVGRRVAGQAML
jgi:hypothetical protein